MSSAASKEPAYYKNEIKGEDIKKLENIFDTMEKDSQAYNFLQPVDYIGLKIFDYPRIIAHPMDLGTVKKNLLKGEYKIFQDLMSDINLIWKNCRTYNLPGSDIVKMSNHCDKKINQLIDKQFKNYQNKGTTRNENSKLTFAEKKKLKEIIGVQQNEELTQIINIILKECPKGFEDMDSEKLQIKLDLLDKKTYDIINEFIEKKKTQTTNEKPKSSRK